MAVLSIVSSLSEPSLVSASNKQTLKGSYQNSNDSRYGGTLTIGDSNQPTLINPILTDHSVSATILRLVFNGLVRVDPTGKIEGDLAYSWDVSSDGLVYYFYLKKGIRFHNDVELTAEDICFTYESIRDPKNKSPHASGLRFIEKLEPLDRYTVKITLSEPHSPFIYGLVRGIMPKHLFDGKDLSQSALNYAPVGSGPFKFKEWKTNEIIFEANKKYHEGRPLLDKVVFRIYPNSSSTWSAFMRQETDMVLFMNVDDYLITIKDTNFKGYAYPTSVYYALFYNLKDPILSDIYVRKAIAYAIDRNQLIQKIEKGYGVECTGPFAQKSPGFNFGTETYSYAPEKSRHILEQAGWKGSGEDGILKKNGQSLLLRILVDSRNDKLRKIAMMLRQELQEIGIGMELQLYDSDADLMEKSQTSQAYLRMNSGGSVDLHHAAKMWGSHDRRPGKVWFDNPIHPEIDRLIQLGCALHNETGRASIYQDLYRLVNQEQPACFLYFPYVFHAVSRNMQNTDPFFNLYMPVYTLKDFCLENGSKREERG